MSSRNLLIIGSSTGGPSALHRVLSNLEPLDAAIVIVQHLPEYITESLASSLSSSSKATIEVAQTGMSLDSGKAFLAPGGKHLKIASDMNLSVCDGEEVNFVRPSVDVTMLSVQPWMFEQVVAVILTGMGRDGAAGIVHLKEMGATTIAQSEETCSVFGMPKMAIETKRIDFVLSPESIAYKIQEIFRQSAV